jgi:bla regulator protein BlaR1
MIPNYLSATWTALAPALGNHLWQSTLFALAAALLTLILRKNHARARYWLWLAASVKFLIPFSLLAGLGSHLAWSHGSAGTNDGLYFAMEEVSQPFTQPAMSMISRATPSTVFSSLMRLLPSLLAAVWLCGFLVVVFAWYMRWRRISAAVRDARPLREGREVETLRRLERIAGRRKRIELLLSQTSLEPGIFGIARPVLVWPKGISERLEDAHLEVILAHELWHVRRRDNLAAALHMLVEAIFWFHPIVWWLGERLVEERERACDEEVLESGSDRQIYAESILKICEFCVGSPVACVSGVTGADLKKRIARIMTERVAHKLDFSRKLLLGAAGGLAVAVPIAFGLLNVTPSRAESQTQNSALVIPVYEVASIKLDKAGTAALKTGGIVSQRLNIGPGTFTAENISMWELIRLAYRVEDYQVSGAPDWFSSELYDVDAKADKSAIDEMQKLGNDQRELENRRMLQTLLKDRFKLTLRQVTKDLPIYSLVVADAGKLHEAQGDCAPGPTTLILDSRMPPCGSLRVLPWVGRMDGLKVPITQLVSNLSGFTKRMVLDNTNLGGKYDINLKWFPGPSEFPPRPAYLPPTYQPDPNSPPLLTAIQQQLGVKLESQTGPVPLLVIDHVEKPSESQAQNTAVIPPVFAVASVKPSKGDEGLIGERLLEKPDGLTATNFTLQKLIRRAYGVEEDQITGAPNWLNAERYDIEAKVDKSVLDALQQLSESQRQLQRKRMLQELLADRFKLALHGETRHFPVYDLVIAQNGSKLQEAKPGDTYPNGFRGPDGRAGAGMMHIEKGRLIAQGVPVALLVRELSQELSREFGGSIIEDKTGLRGNYDFALQWAPEDTRASKFVALQEQLGLKLESQNGPGEILVIDHVEKPSRD